VVVLRVWQDKKRKIDGKWCMMVTHHDKYTDNPENLGYQERCSQVTQVKAGARCFMIMCLVAGPEAAPRIIKSHNEKDLFIGGEIIEQDGDSWVNMAERKPVSDFVVRQAA
jgi:hypothetical protein